MNEMKRKRLLHTDELKTTCVWRCFFLQGSLRTKTNSQVRQKEGVSTKEERWLNRKKEMIKSRCKLQINFNKNSPIGIKCQHGTTQTTEEKMQTVKHHLTHP